MKNKIILILIIGGLTVNLAVLSLMIALIVNLFQVKKSFDQLNIDQFQDNFKNMSVMIQSGLKDMGSLLRTLIRRNNTCNCFCP